MYLYFFKMDGFNLFKIGITNSHPAARLKDIQTGNPFKVAVFDYIECGPLNSVIEYALHQAYSDRRREREWFEIPKEEIILLIDGIREALDHEYQEAYNRVLDELSDVQVRKINIEESVKNLSFGIVNNVKGVNSINELHSSTPVS